MTFRTPTNLVAPYNSTSRSYKKLQATPNKPNNAQQPTMRSIISRIFLTILPFFMHDFDF